MTISKRIKELKNKYKDANIVVSVQRTKFNMKDYYLDSIYHEEDHNSFYIKNNEGEEDRELFNNNTFEYAKIIS
jgi:hypothetical protein